MTSIDLSVIDAKQPVATCDGKGLKRLWQAGLAWLEMNHETVNALNVFPVPDGDTGTNMLLTMRSAFKEVAHLEEPHAGVLSRKLYNGALMGARGNSGVILSQLMRGMTIALEGSATVSAEQFVRMLEEASRTAYLAVQTPVEGTILTVARESAEAVARALPACTDLRELLRITVAECHASVQRTPELLTVLKEAGVVDSGGAGLTYIYEGMLRYLDGHSTDISLGELAERALQSTLEPQHPEGYGYDVQYLLKGRDLDIEQIRSDIEAMGESGVIAGDSELIKVHIHVQDPGIPISYGAQLGVLLDVVVENMQEQYEEFLEERGDNGHIVSSEQLADLDASSIGSVVVAPGKGFVDIFLSLGASQVINGGQTMNPSTKDILDAVSNLPTDRVIILPNNKNIILTAKQAAEQLAHKQIAVIPTSTIPQGISALLALDPGGEFDDIISTMVTMSQHVQTGEITTSVRDVTFDGLTITKGQIIGLHNDVLAAAGETIQEVAVALLEKIQVQDYELLSLYRGNDVTEEEADELVAHLQAMYSGIEIEMHNGGQPHYFYILGVE